MSEKGLDICDTAIGVCQSLLHSLYDGTITPSMVEKLTGRWKQVDKIIEAIDYISSANGEKPQSPKEVLSKRNHEYKEFRKYLKQLQHICDHFDDLNIEG